MHSKKHVVQRTAVETNHRREHDEDNERDEDTGAFRGHAVILNDTNDENDTNERE